MNKRKITYLDVETKHTSYDVEGDWDAVENFGVSVGVIYSTYYEMYGVYLQDECISDMVNNMMKNSELIIGFNIKSFDYRVLMPYSKIGLNKLPSFDMLEEIHKTLGFRVSLNNVASNTLGIAKSGEGVDAPKLYWQGEIDQLVYYCTRDVDITRRVFVSAINNRYLTYYDWNERQKKKIDTSHWKSKATEIIGVK